MPFSFRIKPDGFAKPQKEILPEFNSDVPLFTIILIHHIGWCIISRFDCHRVFNPIMK